MWVQQILIQYLHLGLCDAENTLLYEKALQRKILYTGDEQSLKEDFLAKEMFNLPSNR